LITISTVRTIPPTVMEILFTGVLVSDQKIPLYGQSVPHVISTL
jgi:hypothetical protein